MLLLTIVKEWSSPVGLRSLSSTSSEKLTGSARYLGNVQLFDSFEYPATSLILPCSSVLNSSGNITSSFSDIISAITPISPFVILAEEYITFKFCLV